jgi:RNA polymerase sigma-70 factor, ECF subfamily
VNTEALWRTFHERIHSFIRARVSDPAAAEDILQDVFVKVMNRAGQLRDDEKIAAWLYQIARNAVFDHYRAAAVRTADQIAADLPDAGTDGAAAAQQRLAESLAAMIDDLPEPYREAMRLSEIEGLTQAGLAERSGISLSGAKSRVQRGRERLRELLLDCCHVELDHRSAVVDYWERPRCCDRTSR